MRVRDVGSPAERSAAVCNLAPALREVCPLCEHRATGTRVARIVVPPRSDTCGMKNY